MVSGKTGGGITSLSFFVGGSLWMMDKAFWWYSDSDCGNGGGDGGVGGNGLFDSGGRLDSYFGFGYRT